MIRKTFFLLVSLITLTIAAAYYTEASAAQQNNLPPFVDVTDYGNVHRQQFPVTGSIPLPKGSLTEEDLSNLALFSPDKQQVPVQFAVIGRWLDGSVKWLLLDFQSTQDAGSTARYTLQFSGQTLEELSPLASKKENGIDINTGKLKAIFGERNVTFSLRNNEDWQKVVDGNLVSRIGVKPRDTDTVTQYTLPLANATIETNGPLRAVLKIEGWHTAENGDKFSPSVVRFTFYRGQSFVRIHHTFVNSKNPDTHLITDINLEMLLTIDMNEAVYSTDNKAEGIVLNNQRFAIFQENLAQPTYPPSREFKGRCRVHNGDKIVAEGRRYPGSLVFQGNGLSVGVFLKNLWQMSPKTLVYVPAGASHALPLLQVGIWPGEDAGDFDLMRTEIKKPKHYQEFAEKDRLYHDEKYGPTYVPHDLRHSAMGLSRTHEIVFWFRYAFGYSTQGFETEPDKLDPVELTRLFTMPFVPFVSGEWNVSTNAMGKQVLPGQYRNDIEEVNRQFMDEIRCQIDLGGWYGMLQYGNVRYAYDKKITNWMHYHPKYAWYNSGHMMNGGTMLQALWYQYLRYGEPLDYLLAEARGLNKMDTSTIHYHDDEQLLGNMIRHGGFDPWSGARCAHGEHAPLCGIPIHYYVTGSERAGDVINLIGQRNYRHRNFNHARKMDTDINTMMLYYEFTLDRKYYDRAVEYVNYYYETLDEAKEALTYPEYRTTALRTFYEMCEEREIRRKIGEIFLASYGVFREKRGYSGSLGMAAFAYEISPGREAAERLEKVAENWRRRISGQLGWLDNMVLRGMNDVAKMNAVCYSLYWLQDINKGWVEPVSIHPDGGTFERPFEVTLTCQTEGSTIRYTLDGSEPTERSLAYQGAFTVNRNCTIRTKAFREGLKTKRVTERTFAIGGPILPRDHLELWLKTDAGITQHNSSAISWSDQSGHGRHAQVSPDNAPEFVPNKLNGLPVLRGGYRKYMILRRLTPLKDDCTFIFVSSFTGGEEAGGSIVGDGDDGRIGIGAREFAVRFSAGESGSNARLRQPKKEGSFSVWSVVREGIRVVIYRDGKIATDRPEYVSKGTTMNLGLLMGMRPYHNNFTGELAEILVFNASLSSVERRSVEQYLMEKYGLGAND